MIVIGLGTGRCGTASLSNLLKEQPGAMCFHELNVAAMCFFDTPRPVFNTIEEYELILAGGETRMLTADLSRKGVVRDYDKLIKMERVSLLGDVAYYYLSYVADIAARFPSVRFVCLKRDRTRTVQSWLKQSAVHSGFRARLAARVSAAILNERYKPERNFWMEHNGDKWQLDPMWDKTMPKFAAANKRDAVEKYYDYYYEMAETLARQWPDVFRIYPTEVLTDTEAQRELLGFCGIEPAQQVRTAIRANASA